MFKSQLVLLSLQIGPGFSPKANRPLFPLFPFRLPRELCFRFPQTQAL